MYRIKRGSIITESQYGVELKSIIVTDVKVVNDCQQEFHAQLLEVNGEPKGKDSLIHYLVGGAYGSGINVKTYCADCDDTGLFYQIEDTPCHCQEI